jgi:hypothetical protein
MYKNGINMFNKLNLIYEHILSLTMKNKVEKSFYIMNDADWHTSCYFYEISEFHILSLEELSWYDFVYTFLIF